MLILVFILAFVISTATACYTMETTMVMESRPFPLTFPDYWKNPSPFSKFMRWFPFIGAQVHVAREINSELKQRDPSCLNLWGSNEQRVDAAKKLIAILKDELEWSNDYFIPDDCFEVVAWDQHGDLAVASVFIRMQEDFDVNLTNNEYEELYKMTMGEVVDFLLAKQDKV